MNSLSAGSTMVRAGVLVGVRRGTPRDVFLLAARCSAGGLAGLRLRGANYEVAGGFGRRTRAAETSRRTPARYRLLERALFAEHRRARTRALRAPRTMQTP